MQQEIEDLKKDYAMHSGGGPLPDPTYPLMMKRMTIIGRDQELSQVRPSLMKMSTIIDGNTRAHLVRAWVMLP